MEEYEITLPSASVQHATRYNHVGAVADVDVGPSVTRCSE